MESNNKSAFASLKSNNFKSTNWYNFPILFGSSNLFPFVFTQLSCITDNTSIIEELIKDLVKLQHPNQRFTILTQTPQLISYAELAKFISSINSLSLIYKSFIDIILSISENMNKKAIDAWSIKRSLIMTKLPNRKKNNCVILQTLSGRWEKGWQR